MKNDKIGISLIVCIIVFIIAAFFFWNQSKQVVVEREIPYTESGSSTYKVYLDENDYYDKEYLGEGMQYISSIINYIELDFNYNATYAEEKEYELYKSVTANVVVTDSDDNNKVIYSKKEKIKEERTTVDDLLVNDTIDVDYKKYNAVVNAMKTKYGISANCNLDIDYNLVYTSKNGEISNAKKMTVTIPLSKQMINLKKSEPISESGLYKIADKNSIYNKIMILFTILMIIFTGVYITVLIMRVTGRISRESKYDRFINKALKEYDSYITQTKDESFLPDKPVIKINSFKELIDVRNNIDKTIIYTKLSEDASKFEIIDEVIYEYTVTRDELDK